MNGSLNLTIDSAAKLAGLTPATVRGWCHRGHLTEKRMRSLGDVMSLALMGDLGAMGLPLPAAAEIARGIAAQQHWTVAIAREEERLVLLVRPGGEGEERFIWAVGPRAEAPIDVPAVLLVDLVSIVRRVMTAAMTGMPIDASAAMATTGGRA